ncbi:MAG: c-type cytochrome [Planctomycetota bacterium]
MADRGDTHYHVPNLNKWFACSSLLLFIAAFWMVIDDWQRPWKRHQREFAQIELERAEAELSTPEAQAALALEAERKEQLRLAEARLESRQTELEQATEEFRQARHEAFVATEAAKMAKQIYNWERWGTEEERLHHVLEGDDAADWKQLATYEDEMYRLDGIKQQKDLALERATQALADFQREVTVAELEVKQSTKSIELTRAKRDALDPKDMPTKIANIIRDFPGLDFIGPTLQVKKTVLEDLTFELNFTKKQRIDMCQTCHLAIDQAGYDGEEQPYASHPRLDLFLTAKSPHPMSQVGCTICHRGSGEALDFTRADHRPSNETEGDEWNEEYHWHKQHHWDYPMLTSNHIEGSCVQCHTDSMELIAEDAPKVTEGYRNFERFGCYACHKVEWFPTKRKPGPSLHGIRGKTSPEFVASWIAEPTAFRPTTWMPQVFHLENYAPNEVIVQAEYGTGRDILGQEWNETAVAAVSAFIWDQGRDEVFPPLPVEGDAERGREEFRLVGCLACHNMAPFTEEERAEARDPALRVRTNNEHGPNLRGIATKVTPEWLFAWLKDPAAYWAETRMPDLRLSDQEAADIVAYMTADPEGYFTDVPTGWQAKASPYDREVLEEQARWYFNRTDRKELARRFEEEWKDDHVLLHVVGEKYVLNQGCHSCHDIPGLENAQPIGAELTTWSSKTVDKLDWGFMHEYIAKDMGWSVEKFGEAGFHHKVHELKAYREPWLAQKLRAPRSFDRDKRKNPTEKLRMPRFPFTEAEVDSIVTFVAGLVEDEVERARMVPSAADMQMDKGLRAMRQKNCAACHSIEPGLIEFEDNDGNPHRVRGQLLALDGELLPPPMTGFDEYVAGYVDYIRDVDEDPEFELEDVTARLLEPVPGLGVSGDNVVIENVASVRTFPGWGGDMIDVITGFYLAPWVYDEANDVDVQLSADPDGEGKVRDVDGVYRDFQDEPYDKVRWTYGPPVLWGEGEKLQRDWFFRFLLAPMPLREQLRVRMPTFTYADGEAGAIADYFAHAAERAWPRTFARRFLIEEDLTATEMAELAASEGIAITAAQIQGIVDGDPVPIAANLPKLKELAAVRGFSIDGPVDPSYEAIAQRQPTTLGPLMTAHPDFFDEVGNLVLNGPKCTQCHFLMGEPPTAEGPIAWAPDLSHTRERLRPDWTRAWLEAPAKIYPGTAMPANFAAGESNWQEFVPKPSGEQIEDVLLWLFNLDRAAMAN